MIGFVAISGLSVIGGTSSSDRNVLTWTLTLSEAAAGPVTVSYRFLSGTGVVSTSNNSNGSSDVYGALTGALTFAPGETSRTVSITIDGDSADETDEAVVLEVFAVGGAALAGGASALRSTGWILDDDGAGDDDTENLIKNGSFESFDVAQNFGWGLVVENLDDWTLDAGPQIELPASGSDGLYLIDMDASPGNLSISQVVSLIEQGVTYTLSFDARRLPGFDARLEVWFGGELISVVDDADTRTNAWTTLSWEVVGGSGDGSNLLRLIETGVADNSGTYLDAVRLVRLVPDTPDGSVGNLALFVSRPLLAEGDAGARLATFEVSLSRPATSAFTVGYATVDGSATAGEDYEAQSGTLSFVAGQSSVWVTVRVNGDTVIEPTESFTLVLTAPPSVAAVSAGEATIENDDFQNAPVAVAESYTVAAGGLLSIGSPGVLANDTDVEGDDLTAELVASPTKGTLTFNADGSFAYQADAGATGTDSFDYRAFDGADYSAAVTVTIKIDEAVVDDPGSFDFDVSIPESLRPGVSGTGSITYERVVADGEIATPLTATLFFLESDAALIRDPLTGAFTNSIFLLAYGDGTGLIEDGEAGLVEFEVKGTAGPRADYEVSASVIDIDASVEWVSTVGLLRPVGISDAAWNQLSGRLTDLFGDTGADFANALGGFGQRLASFGLNGESASAALAFAADVAGDFGGLAQREQDGSLGRGWTSIADIGLEILADGIVLRGLAELSALRALDASAAAVFTLSQAASRAVTLSGDVIADAPRPPSVFVKSELGQYVDTTLADGELVKTEDGYEIVFPDGAVLSFDETGRFLRLTEADATTIVAGRDPAGALVSLSGPQGSGLTFTRNAEGRVTEVVETDGSSVALAYDSDGRLVGATADRGAASFAYQGATGQMVSASAPGLAATSFAYDAAGKLTGVDYAGGLQSETFAHDGVGGVTFTDGEARTTTVEYLPGGVVGRVTDGDGGVSSLVFDADGDLTGIRAPDGTETGFTFDDLGRITSLTDANGATVSFGYVRDSQAPATFTDASGSTRAFTYDAGGRITEAEWADGTSLEFSYDAAGNLVMSENRRGEAIDYTYDADGRLIAQSDGSSGAVAYSYDAQGRLTSAVDDRGVTAFDYDAAGRITKISYPEGRSLSYTYNEAGLRTSMTDQSGDALFYDYDALGRLIGLDDADGAIVDYTYDAAGNLIREENGNGTVSTFAYDAANRLTEIVNARGDGTVNSFYRYTYDTAGQRVAMQSHDGTWTYGYDAIGQLTSAAFDSINPLIADKSLVYEYDAAGNRTRVVEDGVETLYTTNALNQYTRVGDATYTYDADGNMVSKTDPSGTTTYGYDLNNRLVRLVEASGTIHEHEYDVLGNRVATTTDDTRTEYLLDSFGYGNVVSEYSSDGMRNAQYVYGLGLTMAELGGSTAFYDSDAYGSVGTITSSTGASISRYAYDPFGTALLSVGGIDNRYKFGGLLGVSESRDSSYYMRARDYFGQIGRFNSEDPRFLSGDSHNLYRFAHNNPIQFSDASGEAFFLPLVAVAWKWSALVATAYNTYTIANYLYNVSGIEIDLVERVRDFIPGDESNINGFDAWYSLIGLAIGKVAKLSEQTDKGGRVATLFDEATQVLVAANTSGVAEELLGVNPAEASDGRAPGVPREGSADNSQLPAKDSAANNDAAGSVTRGDPWISSFDYNGTFFNAHGEFVLARSDDGTFEVQARQLPIGWFNGAPSPSITSNYAAATRIGEDKVEIQWTGPGVSVVLVNGGPVVVEVGESIAVGDGAIHRYATTGYVVSNGLGDGMSVVIGGSYLDIYPFIDPSRAGKVEGVHGNYDGNPLNDFSLPDGTDLTGGTGRISFQNLYTTFADAWRVTDETSLFTYLTGQGTGDFTSRDYPAGLVRLEDLDPAAVAQARAIATAAGLTPGTWLFETTVFDIAFTGDASYADTSAEAPGFVFVDADGELVDVIVAEVDAPPVVGALTATVDEDGTVTIDALAAASDPEGAALVLIAGDDPNGGAVTVEDGKLVFAPAPDFNGATEVTFIIRDAAGNETEGVVTVTVAPVNDDPVAAADTLTISEDGPAAAVAVRVNDDDVDGDPLLIVAVNQTGLAGVVTLAADGLSLSYDPADAFEALADGQTDTQTFTYTIADGNGATDTATVTVTIEGANDAPAFVGLPAGFEIVENTTAVATLTAAYVDAGAALSFAITGGADAALFAVDPATGALRFLVAPDFEAPASADGDAVYDVIVGVSDGKVTTTADLDVTVIDADEGAAATVTISVDDASEAEGDDASRTVTFTLTRTGSTANAVTASLATFGPAAAEDFSGAIPASLTIAAGQTTASFTLSILGDNAVEADEALGVEITALDRDDHDVTTAQASHLVINDDAIPVAADDAFTTDEDTAFGPGFNLFADNGGGEDTDPDGDDFAIIAVNGAAIGVQQTLASGALLTVNADGTFAYDPNGAFETLANGEFASDRFSYTITDGNGATDTAEATVRVEGLSDEALTQQIVVYAAGENYLGDPRFDLLVNGVLFAEDVVVESLSRPLTRRERDDLAEAFVFELDADIEVQSVSVVFDNDRWNGTRDQDRNLLVSRVEFGGETYTPEEHGVFTPKGGLNSTKQRIVEADGAMFWNGELEFAERQVITVFASGENYLGNPKFDLSVNGTIIAHNVEVESPTGILPFREREAEADAFRFKVDADLVIETIGATYRNDKYEGQRDLDRNIFIPKITIDDLDLRPDQGATFNKQRGENALLEEKAGTFGHVFANGTLLFDTDDMRVV